METIQLPQLNFPSKYNIRLKRKREGLFVFCPLRKNFFKLTPEEWVRQNCIQFLNLNKGINLSSMSIEKQVQSTQFRTDLVIYNKGVPAVLVECKAPKISVEGQEIMEQIFKYQYYSQFNKIYLTNGLLHRFLIVQGKQLNAVNDEEFFRESNQK